MVQVQVPPGASAGQTVTVEIPVQISASKHGFKTLFEAFNHCDPQHSGCITDRNLFAKVARSLAGERREVNLVWGDLDQDGNGAVNFPEFVEWAEAHDVGIPIGLDGGAEGDCPGDQVAYPSTWTGPRDNPQWNERIEVKDSELLEELGSLLENSYKKVWTRDRKSTGINKVPDGYTLQRAMKNENFKDWRGYYLKRHMLAHQCTSKPFVQHRPLTEMSTSLTQRHKLRPYVNEWFLFHGTSAAAAEEISRGDFTMTLAGSATGTLYGKGIYFSESVTKADEYAKEGPDGTCCILVCRVVGGYVLYTDEVTPDPDRLQSSVISGAYDSILGDREKCRGTFREFVVFDADQIYVDYLLFYKRVFS